MTEHMKYIDNWSTIQKRYREFWARENSDRPIINITAQKSGNLADIAPPASKEQAWLDSEYIIKSARSKMENTVFGAEAFPQYCPNLGPDVFGASFGADIVFEETTSYSVPFVDDWDNYPKLNFSTENEWWKKMLQITKDVVADAKGDYFVGITDLHPGADGVVSLRGPENVCIDLYDEPERVKQAVFELLPAFQYQFDELYNITKTNLEGSSNWMGIWHPEKWYVTSADIICMLSTDMFDEFILPELLQELDWLKGNSIFHLDGPGALKHLDRILEIPNLAGVQWVYGAGQPTAAHWIPTLKKIQDAGKCIQVNTVTDDIDVLIEELRPEGVMYCFEEQQSVDDMNAIIKKFENGYKKKIY